MVVMQLFSGDAGVLAKNKFSFGFGFGFCCSFYFISTVII